MRAVLFALVLAVAIGACSDEVRDEELRGVVIDIDSRGLGDVQSFTLKDLDKTYEIYIDPNISYEFPVSHLAAHRAAAEPLLVGTEKRDDRIYALSITDG